MPRAIVLYVRAVDRVSRLVGLVAMYLVFAMMGVLLYSSFAKTFTVPPLWGIELAQFIMTAYFLLGGAYSMRMDAHVRMDLLYSRGSPRTRAAVDAVTILFLLVYIVFLLIGGWSSTAYALQYDEQSYSAWAPYMAPIKIIMMIGIALMLLQVIATFFRDFAAAWGRPIDPPHPADAPERSADVPGQETSRAPTSERDRRL